MLEKALADVKKMRQQGLFRFRKMLFSKYVNDSKIKKQIKTRILLINMDRREQ